MKPILAAAALVLISGQTLHAQSAPFDMSKERPAAPAAETNQGTTAPPAVPQQPVIPDQTTVPEQPPMPPQQVVVPAEPVQAPKATGGFRRPIIPFENLGLSGEVDTRSWSVYLTPQQAASGAKLDIGYQNSIVVAPEISKLQVQVNNTTIADEPIRSSDAVSQLSFDIPAGLLQPGSNLVSFQSSQRHRTDCSIESTYELWANVDPARSGFFFEDARAGTLSGIDDIRAIGVDGKGHTRFDFVAPALEQPGATAPLMRLAQGLAVLANMPNQSFSFDTVAKDTQVTPGQMTVMVGTATELRSVLPSLPGNADMAPLAGFIDDPKTGASILVLSGPTWQAVQSAIESIVAPTEPMMQAQRDTLVTQRWRSPDTPLLFSDSSLRFSQLGVRTSEFSGRRFRTDFAIGVPSDFYADAYGEATILLDAAYSEVVLPGSHIDVYVNGSIASTVPITSTGGGILRHLPINVTMRHFRPGLNTIAIEAVLLTDEDKQCTPGATASTTPRFALFDTSEFRMPDFARIGQLPNLAATGGTGFPYRSSAAPTPVFIDRLNSDTLSATATFLGRLATAAGQPIAIETVASPALIGNRNAIFIGAVSQIPQTVLSQMNISEAAQTSWASGSGAATDTSDTEQAFDEWRSKVRGGTWSGQISAFEDWLKRNFDISLSSLRFAPGVETSFAPPAATTLLVAQGPSPDDTGIWTLLTAPTGRALRDAMLTFGTETNWPQLAGHITTYDAAAKKIETVPVTRFNFIPTQPITFANYRLIAANWLSTNILSYAVMLVVLAIALGLATASLLGTLGRRQ